MTDYDLSSQEALIHEIETLFIEKLSVRVESTETDLFETGILDSVSMVRLLLQMEEHFGLSLPMEDLGPDSFRSVARIAELVASRRRADVGQIKPANGLSNGSSGRLQS